MGAECRVGCPTFLGENNECKVAGLISNARYAVKHGEDDAQVARIAGLVYPLSVVSMDARMTCFATATTCNFLAQFTTPEFLHEVIDYVQKHYRQTR